jgi:hypothetical protein
MWEVHESTAEGVKYFIFDQDSFVVYPGLGKGFIYDFGAAHTLCDFLNNGGTLDEVGSKVG